MQAADEKPATTALLELTFTHPDGKSTLTITQLDAVQLGSVIEKLIQALTPILTHVLSALIASFLGGLTPAPAPTPPAAS
jgi:hypothetical protein